MPRASRANGERIWVAGARRDFFLAADERAARLEGAVLRVPSLPRGLLRERVDERGVGRRDGEVFVAIRGSV
jgi:hypothetical protein